MDQIEPVRLDMNLLNMAMMQGQHQAALAETVRHHGVMEQASDAASQKIQTDALQHVITNPEMPVTLRHQAASKLYSIATKGQGQQLDPIDYTTYMGKWNAFLTANQQGTQSQEAAQAAQDLVQYSPFAREEMKAAQARQQAVETNQGFASMPTRAGQPALSPQESLAVQTSPPAQKAIAESAFPSAKDTAVMHEVNQRTAGLKVQEATATYAYQAMNKEMTPVLNMDAEEAHLKSLPTMAPGSPLTSKLSTKDRTDQSALMAGTLTTDEREQARQAIPEAMKDMNQRARALQQELHNAKNDVTGQARPPEQIQADLQAIRTAVTIKGKELAYLSNPTTPNRLAVKQAYDAFQKDLDQKKAEVLRLRQQSSTVAQGALNEKIAQDQFQNKQKLDLASAQQHYLEHKDLNATAKLFPNIPADDIRQIDKDLNKPQVSIDMADKTAGREFIQSTRTTYDQLKNAPAQLKNLADAKALIPKAKGFMGPGGESMLEAAKFLNNRLGMSINTEGVKGAEELRSRIFFNVMDNLKKMDAQPSQMQQIVMMDSLGKLGTDPQALTNVLNAYEDSIRNKVEVHNTEVQGAMNQGTKFPYDPRIKLPARVEEGTAAPTTGTVKSKEDYDKLPSGATYKAPDGTMRKKK